jgi:hypothetical protein
MCGVPWVNCAVLCVTNDWKGQFWGLRYCLSKLRSLPSFSSGMMSHRKIAQFNWECIASFTLHNFNTGSQCRLCSPASQIRVSAMLVTNIISSKCKLCHWGAQKLTLLTALNVDKELKSDKLIDAPCFLPKWYHCSSCCRHTAGTTTEKVFKKTKSMLIRIIYFL